MTPAYVDWLQRLRIDARDLLSSWPCEDAALASHRADFLHFLKVHDDAMSRDCAAGHLTASALIVDADATRVLLTLHPKVGLWLQTGGHCEATDASVRAAALREAREESGIIELALSILPAQLDRHTINCRPGVVLDHLDVQYVAVAGNDSTACISDESLDLQWFAFDDLPRTIDASTRSLVARARVLVEEGEFV